jgi:hypothetical protein
VVRHRGYDFTFKEIGCDYDTDWIHVTQDRDHLPGCCEHGTELKCSIKGEEFLDLLNECYRLKRDSAARSLFSIHG